jgi:peptide/nickel transport system permease protein
MSLDQSYRVQNIGDETAARGNAPHTVRRVVKYIFVKGITILITIFIGVFITEILANRGGQIESIVKEETNRAVDQEYPGWIWMYPSLPAEEKAVVDNLVWTKEESAGLHLPYWPRQLVWTIKALRFDWKNGVRVNSAPGSYYHSNLVSDIILTDLPHTLLLVGPALLLLFLIGIPLALFIFRRHGSWYDHLITGMAALSSVPSWVFGVILVLIFAVNLGILPPEGMYDPMPITTAWQRATTISRHLLLPILAILLSLLLQYVYSWRTFFLLTAEEDYVELAEAKGLPRRRIERNFILRPTLPYIVTNFAILLVSFWQMTFALEKIFNWPGIGRLYIITLPNFFGERFYPGIMPVTLSIVVLFAYLLGILVFILDIVYAFLDPRIRIGDQNQTMRISYMERKRFHLRFDREKRSLLEQEIVQKGFDPPLRAQRTRVTIPILIKNVRENLQSLRDFFTKIAYYPSAVFGLVVIFILITGSIYAVIAYPYNQLGSSWYSQSMTGQISAPKLGQPAWVNWFRKVQLPPMIILDSQDNTVKKTIQPSSNGVNNLTITYTIQYPYGEFPQGLIVYFTPSYEVKYPFAYLTWITPDGRETQVGSLGTASGKYYTFMDQKYINNYLLDNPIWRNWFVDSGNYPTPAVNLLFADPSSDKPQVLPGAYTLRIDGLTFENGSDLDAKVVLIGQVYGVAGTDINRRDLLVPLLWGMPFALIFGLLGACVTTILSVILAATSAWFGGWVDNAIQRLVEANMVLPVIGISVLIYAYFNTSIWTLLAIIVLLNVFGSPIKSFRATFMQLKESPYIEAAKAYGASNRRLIFRYLIPRITPILIPQLVILLPSYVFLEATLGIFMVRSDYPTWGRVIYEALLHGGNYGSGFWVIEPIGLLLLTGLAFTMLGFALERILNPKIA